MTASLRQSAFMALVLMVFTTMATIFAASPARADDFSAEAADHIQVLGDDLLRQLEVRKGDPDLKRELSELLATEIALENIARFALGRYWRIASVAEQQEYQDLFGRLVTRVYVSRFDDYSGQTFEVTGYRMGTSRDALVSTRVAQPNGPPIDVDWRIRRFEEKMKIIDIIVGGVSMAVTQRSEFASIIQNNRGRVSALIDNLRAQLADNGSQAANRAEVPGR
ncbi:MAG: ABC transporter substrate-binding protein [Alphaproteobacteria bacterium]